MKILLLTLMFLISSYTQQGAFIDKSKKQIKETLLKFETNQFKVDSSFQTSKFVFDNLELLGNLDPVLRDRLFSSALFTWIYSGKLTNTEIEELANKMISKEYLFYKISSKDSLAVYKRTFSVLVICGIVDYQHKKNIMDIKTLIQIKDKIIEYVKSEKNVAGYSTKYGWAHSVAHTADAILAITQISNLDKKAYYELADAIKILILKGEKTYQHLEEDRLARAFFPLIKNNKLSDSELTQFINKLLDETKVDFNTLKNFYENTNVLSFLKALYFYVENDNQNKDLTKYLSETIKREMRIIK